MGQPVEDKRENVDRGWFYSKIEEKGAQAGARQSESDRLRRLMTIAVLSREKEREKRVWEIQELTNCRPWRAGRAGGIPQRLTSSRQRKKDHFRKKRGGKKKGRRRKKEFAAPSGGKICLENRGHI